MPAYYDESTKTWYCKFYYTDYTGAKKQKKKRGFKLQREAREWERAFLERLQGTPDMTFQALYDLYYRGYEPQAKAEQYRRQKERVQESHTALFQGQADKCHYAH